MNDAEPYARLDDQHLVWQVPDELGREVARRWRRLNDEVDRLKAENARLHLATTLVKCEGCGGGARWRYAVKEMCPDCAAGAIDRLIRERDAAILRQVRYAGDGSGRDRWTIEGANSSGWAEKVGPYHSEADAFAAVLAWVRYEVDSANPTGPTEDEEPDDDEEETP